MKYVQVLTKYNTYRTKSTTLKHW